MNFFFRCDASISIGSGHVMRCLTLANLLKDRGESCRFLCKNLEGNLIQFIKKSGYDVDVIEPERNFQNNEFYHSSWLQSTQEYDAKQCLRVIQENDRNNNIVIVDHYALSQSWENIIRSVSHKMIAIDDLADRKHHVELLIDSGLSRNHKDYDGLVNETCQLLIGVKFVPLRPEFTYFHKLATKIRNPNDIKKILINLGGVDKDNLTSKILQILENDYNKKDVIFDVILGATSPWIESIQKMTKNMKNKINIHVGVSNIHEFMLNADIAIGAAGSTSWERCCLGLPTVLICIAQNQIQLANDLDQLGVAKMLKSENLEEGLILKIQELSNMQLLEMSQRCLQLIDGQGASRILSAIELLYR